MRASVLLLTLLSLPAVSQTIVGTVEKIDKDQLQVKGRDGMVTLRVDENTTVRKIKTSHDLSLLTVGDEVRVTCYGEGALTAVNVSAQVTLSGVITESSSTHLTVVPNSTPDTTSSDRKAAVFVFLGRTTQFGESRSQVTAGRKVHIVGWDSGDGVVDAEKVAIYDADPPARPNPARRSALGNPRTS